MSFAGLSRQTFTAIEPKELRAALFAFGVAVCLLLPPVELFGQISTTAEYRTKASFLSNFPSFVEWPANVFSSPNAPFLICVFGDFSFGTSLAENTRGITVHGRRVDIKWTHKEAELHACQILFVSRSDAKNYTKVLDSVKGDSVLTVGETPGFLEAGGAVFFTFQEQALQFEINLPAVDGAHLKMSSRLLSLARRVVNRLAEAKS